MILLMFLKVWKLSVDMQRTDMSGMANQDYQILLLN